jgi:hypothetical protein
MLAQLIVTVIVIAVNSGLLDGTVHAFDLAIGPGMFDLGQTVINVMSGASTLECVTPEQLSFRSHLPDVHRCPAAACWISELNAVVGEDRVDGVDGVDGVRDKQLRDCQGTALRWQL